MAVTVRSPDPAWAVAIRTRQALLWIGPSWRDYLGAATCLPDWLVHYPWAAIYIDAPDLLPSHFSELPDLAEGIKVRVFSDEPAPDTLPPNRLPFYLLRGSRGDVAPGQATNPAGMLNRLTMLSRMPADRPVFAIGIRDASDGVGVVEATKVTPSLGNVVLIGGGAHASDVGDRPDRQLVAWEVDAPSLKGYLESIRKRREHAHTEILIRSDRGQTTVDLGAAIDGSNPIDSAFEWIPSSDVLRAPKAEETILRAYLADPAASWGAYAAGIPYPRHQAFETKVQRLLNHIRKDGPSATGTAWITAEDGSGATTVLRQVCYNLAREGYPVLVARPHVQVFDFRQLATFLRAAAAQEDSSGASIADIPWIIAFDASHVLLASDFVTSLANRLKGLIRPALVLAIRPMSIGGGQKGNRALGTNHLLEPPLRNTVQLEEAVDVGRHFEKLIPTVPRRSNADWLRFLDDTVRTGHEGTASLFWLALRFWLLPFEGKQSSIREWLATKFHAASQAGPQATAGLLEIAAMARYKVPTPCVALETPSFEAVRQVADDGSNVFGLRRVPHGQQGAVVLVHAMIAEELLRIAMQQAEALSAVGLPQCFNMLDLELHLLGRILKRRNIGLADCLDVIEDLAVNGLRVDKREAPRNFEVRDRIVSMLEHVPDAVWDQSPIFVHHLARARRVLATNPPDERWDVAARREQLELAENHLVDARERNSAVPVERQESLLALEVTSALTFVARAALEEEANEHAVALEYEAKAEASYLRAQRLDSDNTHLLENYARFKVRRAAGMPFGSERTELLVEAISLLEMEQQVDEFGDRMEPVSLELARAYEMMDEGGGRSFLESLAATAPEIALTALARMTLRSATGEEAERLVSAENLLRRIPAANTTWRSTLLLYRVVTARRRYAFAERLELLDLLSRDDAFAWPLQLRLEHAILLIQLGRRREGKALFKDIRDILPTRSAAIEVPTEMRFLADPQSGYQEPLQTSILVTNTSSMGRNFYGVPHGWGTEDVPFRPWVFGRDRIKVRDDLDCRIQFTNFGPQAVPPTSE